jgi:hypothetical protein
MEVILETLIEFCFHIILNQLQHGSISRFQLLTPFECKHKALETPSIKTRTT